MMPRIVIINNAEPEVIEFVTPLQKIVADAGMISETIDYAESPDYNFDSIDGIILSGSPQGDDIVEHHLPYFGWLQTIEKPVIGICAGHHITGFLYGSELLRSKEPESGKLPVEVVKNDPVFKSLPKQLIVKQMHNDSVTLPGDFDLLATSIVCKNQMMKHKARPLYTCQFHPEFYNKKIIRNFLEMI